MTTPTGEAAPAEAPAPAPRQRPARRALDELTLAVTRADVEEAGARDALGGWLRDDRATAFEAYSALPGESNRLYTPYIDLRPAQLDGAAVVRPEPAGGVQRTDLPAEADGLLVIGEGQIVASALSASARRAGVVLTSVWELQAEDADRARALLADGGTLPADDKFAQLTRALWSLGVVLDVPAGVQLDRPIIVRWELGAPDRALLTRTIVRLGEGATASLVEEFVPSGEVGEAVTRQAFYAGTTEVRLGTKSSLRVASLQELPSNVVAFQHRAARIGEGADLQWALAQLGGRLVRSRVDNRLDGDHSSVEQVEIVFGGEDQLFDLTSYTTHVGRDTTGNLLSKGALLDRSRSYMKGLITIERSAVGTDSFLGEFGMNLSKAARAVAIPSLEIDQPDCRRAAHSSSVGPIDESQLFYLESRGIDPDDARKFIVLGFLEPVVARVPLADVQDRLRELLEAKWAAGSARAGAAA
jgi:Fe-S cluster assembly scaffold protein SufB